MKSLMNFNCQKCSRVKRNICVDFLLIVEARLERKETVASWYIRKLQHILIGLYIFDVGEIFGAVPMLEHEIFIIVDGESHELFHHLIVLGEFEVKLVDE